MSSALDYRIITKELDFSGFVNPFSSQVGAMCVKSRKGPNFPVACRGEADVIKYFGIPSAQFPSVFEAIDYSRVDRLWVVSAYGEGAASGGIDVRTNGVTGFGRGCGRDLMTFNDYTAIKQRPANYSSGVGTGTTDTFTGTIPNIDIDNPINEGSFEVYLGGTLVNVTELNGVLSGSAVSSGTLDKVTGSYLLVFSGTPGQFASYTSIIDGALDIDLSAGTKEKAINLLIDGDLYENISFGDLAATTLASIVSAINTAVGSNVASEDGQFITITGVIADSIFGGVRISAPTDLATYDSAVELVFAPGETSIEVTGVDPIGSIPKYNQTVQFSYTTTSDQTENISHSFFAFSPASMVEYGTQITQTGPVDFTLDLFEKRPTGYGLLQSFNYSLEEKKDVSGRSLYIHDVFRDNGYVVPVVNIMYTDTISFSSTSTIDLTGGDRGADPQLSDYETAWNHFRKVNKYRVKNFMDVIGNAPGKILEIRGEYQKHAFCIATLPFGNATAQDLIAARQATAIDSDQIALYHGWHKIVDSYNNSIAWASRIGALGVVYAEKNESYDAPSPAGITVNDEGGQIRSSFRPIEGEVTDLADSDYRDLDNAQVNLIILDDVYGLMAVGDKTAQSQNTDTSNIGTRRLYNLIITTVREQILRKSLFKFINEETQRRAFIEAENYVTPIVGGGYLTSATVICDETNNTDITKQQGNFILTIIVQSTPTAQKATLEFIRLPQGNVIADFLPGA